MYTSSQHHKTTALSKNKYVIQKGDLFSLGDHRLLCGDSEDICDIGILARYRRFHLVFSGPPYFNQRSYCYWKTYDLYLRSMNRIIGNCLPYTKEGGIFAFQLSRGCTEHKDHVGFHSMLLEKHGLKYQDAIAWIKPGANYSIKRFYNISSRGFYYPAFKWEVVLVYRVPGPMNRMSISDRKIMAKYETDVWTISPVLNQMKRFGHPSVNPVELPQRCILAYVPNHGYILDPFGGSGTTLIAAEQTGRRCYMMERKPHYCQIILRRWENLTGKKVTRIKTI